MKLSRYIKERQKLINKRLKILIPGAERFPSTIYKAMHYCIKGGKKIRPVLCMASCKICGGSEKDALLTACAIEMIHTYSLIHDDLPSMDNDDYRRGQPACHRKFNEAVAILTADAFHTLAYNTLSQATKNASINNRIIKEISDATGAGGMIGGQLVDIENSKFEIRNSKLPINLPTVEYIAMHKTGALIAASCKVGAIIAGASKRQEEAIFRYGEYIGFAFQIIDDVLDDEGIAKIFKRKGAYKRAQDLVNMAKGQLFIFKRNKTPLLELADFILKRRR